MDPSGNGSPQEPLDPRALFGEIAEGLLAEELASGPCVGLMWALSKKYTNPLQAKKTLCEALRAWRKTHRTESLEELKAFLGLDLGEATKEGLLASGAVLQFQALVRFAEDLLAINEAYLPRLEDLEKDPQEDPGA